MDWRALRELKAAEEAERIAGIGGGGDFGEAPSPLTSLASQTPYEEPDANAFSAMPAPPKPAAPKPPSTVNPFAKAGEFAFHTAGDAFDTVSAPFLTGGYMAGRTIGKALGAEMPGSYSEDLQKGASDLFALPYRLGQTLEGRPTERKGLAKQTIDYAIESGKGAFEPGATSGESARMLGGALAGGIAAFTQPGGFGTIPFTKVNPVFDLAKAAAPGLERGGASFLKHVMRERPAEVPMQQWLSRRGVINMPGQPKLTTERGDRIARIAEKIGKGDEDKTQDAWLAAMMDPRQIDTLSDQELRSIMGDFVVKEARKAARQGVPLERADMVADPMRTPMRAEDSLGLSDEASREILAGAPMEAPKPARASTYAPRGESSADAASRLERVQKAIAEGGDVEKIMEDVKMLPREDVFDLALELGGNAKRNKGIGEQVIREALEKKALQPTQTPTTPSGRQEMKELEAAKEAERIASEPVVETHGSLKAGLEERSGISGQPEARTESPTPASSSPPQAPEPPPPKGPSQPISENPSSATPPERNPRWYAANHIDSLENASLKANNPEGRALAERLRENIVYGESNAAKPMKRINDSGEKVLRSPAAREEAAELFAPSEWAKLGAPDLRAGRFQAAVDSNAERMFIRPEERMLNSPELQQYAKDHVGVIGDLGHEAERLGVMTADGNPFVAKEDRFIQQIDPSASQWMVDGDPTFKKLKDQLSAIYPDQDVNAMGEALKGMAGLPVDRPAAFEFERVIPMMPAAIVDDAGVTRPILRYVPIPTAVNSSNPIARIVESQWMRLGGIKALGQDLANAMAETDEAALAGSSLGQALASTGPEVPAAARGAIGAIYRRPEAGYVGANPATWDINKSTSKFAQGFRSLFGRVIPAMNLSAQGVKSIPQTLGEVPAMAGAMNYARAVGKTLMQYGKASEEAEMAGAVHRKFLEAGAQVYDRHRLIESKVGAVVNKYGVTERFNDFVKDMNDTIAYTAGAYKADNMLARGAKQSDFVLMDEMNLPQEVQDVFRFPSQYDDAAKAAARQTFGRAVSKETQFHAKNPALRGRFENDAALRWVMPYMGYSINTAKNTVKDFERVIRMSQKGNEGGGFFSMLNPFGQNREPFRNAMTKLVSRFVGMELAGEVVADLSSTMQGKDPLRSDRSATARILENLSYVGFLGPLHFAFDMAASNLLEGDEQKKFAQARAGSRAPTLGNPTIETGLKALKNLATGDVGEAAYDVTAGASPAISGIARATGLIEPSGAPRRGLFEKPKRGLFDKSPSSRKGLFDKPSKKRGLFERVN